MKKLQLRLRKEPKVASYYMVASNSGLCDSRVSSGKRGGPWETFPPPLPIIWQQMVRLAVMCPGYILPCSWSQLRSPLSYKGRKEGTKEGKEKQEKDPRLFSFLHSRMWVSAVQSRFQVDKDKNLKNSHFEKRDQKWRKRTTIYPPHPAGLSDHRVKFPDHSCDHYLICPPFCMVYSHGQVSPLWSWVCLSNCAA